MSIFVLFNGTPVYSEYSHESARGGQEFAARYTAPPPPPWKYQYLGQAESADACIRKSVAGLNTHY